MFQFLSKIPVQCIQIEDGTLWSSSYGSLIYSTTTCVISAYHHKSCVFKPRSWRSVLNTTLCDKVCQWLATGRWFSPGTLISSINKTDRHVIGEILLKVALNTINHKPKPSKRRHYSLSLFLSLIYNIPYAQLGTDKGSKGSEQQIWPGGGYGCQIDGSCQGLIPETWPLTHMCGEGRASCMFTNDFSRHIVHVTQH